jgi:hypothetical protein
VETQEQKIKKLTVWQMQAPEVTVVLRASRCVTFERRQELFDDAVTLAAASSEYGHVFRGYRQVVSRERGCTLVKLVPVDGDCGVGERLESRVYRGLVAVLTEIGMMSVVNEEGDGRIRIEPQRGWREPETDVEMD